MNGAIAQLGERLNGIQEADGSSPSSSISFPSFNHLEINPLRRPGVLLFRQPVGHDDLQNVFAGRELCPEVERAADDDLLPIGLRPNNTASVFW